MAQLAITFLEGVVTFVSPCLLPMLPIYVAYFAGGTAGEDGEGAPGAPGTLARTLRCAVAFVAGFTVVFCALGALAGGLGSSLSRGSRALDVACGAVVVVLGLDYLGVLRLPALERTLRPRSAVVPHGVASSLAFGVVFALGWTPCVGPFLAAALGMAATSGETLAGVALLLAFSLGLGLPFVLAAAFIDRLGGALGWVRSHQNVVDRLSGALLVVVGVLMATGTFGLWLRALAV